MVAMQIFKIFYIVEEVNAKKKYLEPALCDIRVKFGMIAP